MPVSSSQKSNDSPQQHAEPISIELGKRIKKLRIDANRSQAELAFDCELDRTYISLIERGLANPSLLTLGTLAFALKTTVGSLLEGNVHIVMPSMGVQGRKRRANQASHDAQRMTGSRRSQLR